jgi:ABC-2 type transport system permease protein
VRGVLRRLAATPVSPLVMIAAPILVRVVIVALQIALVLAVSAGVFAFRPSADRWLAATAMLALGTVTFVALGLTIASVARTAEAGNAIGSALQMPMLFLSGVLFPVQSAPAGLRPLMALWPSTHLADALSQTLTHAAPVFGLGVNTAVLGAWLLVCGALSSRGFAVR